MPENESKNAETVKGVIKKVLCDKFTWAVVSIKKDDGEMLTCRGNIPAPAEGVSVCFKGKYVIHPQYGRQFEVEEAEDDAGPTLRIDNIVNLLTSDVAYGIGRVLATRIVNEFGLQTLDVIKNTPEKLNNIKGISHKKIEGLCESVKKATVIFDILLKYKMSKNDAVKIAGTYGEKAFDALNDHPYDMIEDIEGFGFRRVDKIVLNNGGKVDAPERLAAAMKYVLENEGNFGHTYSSLAILQKDFIDLIQDTSITSGMFNSALDLALKTRKVVCEYDCYFPGSLYKDELTVADCIHQMMNGALMAPSALLDDNKIDSVIKDIEEDWGFELEGYQNAAVKKSLRNRLSIITGGPGTGKTTIVKAVVRCWQELVPNSQAVLLCAPTGRAAKRMEETSGCPACTIHRLLLEEGFGKSNTFMQMSLDVNGLIIIDEASMIDIPLAARLMQFIVNKGLNAVFVGDADQLPPVGPGKFFKDVIRTPYIPKSILKLSHRQNGIIAENADKVNKGVDWDYLCFSDNVMSYVPTKESDDHVALTKKVISQYLKLRKMGYAVEDIGVLTPMKAPKERALSTYELNQEIRNLVNPHNSQDRGCKVGNDVYYKGDRVMNLKNDYDLGICNGDIGTIINTDTVFGGFTVLMDGATEPIDVYGEQASQFTLAYAMTVHKAQGSEYPAVIIGHTMRDIMLLQRNLIYTAITRAKRKVILVGEEKAFRRAIQNVSSETRRTKLWERLNKQSVTPRLKPGACGDVSPD